MQADLTPYLPEWFRQIADFNTLLDAESAEFEVLAAYMDAVRNNFHVRTADEDTIAQFERIFSIVPMTQEGMDFRRARILNRLSTHPPFTLPFLYEKLDLLIGKGNWSVTIDYAAYTLYVEAAAENQAWANEVFITLSTLKPCHIAYINRPFTAATVLISEQVGLKEAEYKYKLGAWGLGMHPFAVYKDKGVIVTTSQKSVLTALLNGIATFTASEIASVRLNGTLSITKFDVKQAANNVTTVQYTVENTQLSVITKVELLRADKTALIGAQVYVPVSTIVQLRHTITTKEGV